MSTKRVLLYDIETAYIVIECSSGVVYQNQVGGQICFQAELEGVLAPLNARPESANMLTERVFPQGLQGIDPNTADFLDELFRKDLGMAFLTVDRARLADSWEAWIYVRIGHVPDSVNTTDQDRYSGALYGFSGSQGVITWPNSD
jgi:Family of unknown function (DUF6210)